MGQFAIGQSVPRTEDPRLLTGRGRYFDDSSCRGRPTAMSCARRMPMRGSKRIDTRAAQQMPGVLAVLTGADCAADGLGSMPCRRCRASAATARRCTCRPARRSRTTA